MGQKVGGYRRNVPYGTEKNQLVDRHLSGEKVINRGWIFRVNPKGRSGWNRGTSGRTEKDYGKHLSESRRLRKELEEVRKSLGCHSNGLGRKGTTEGGYVVYGEYTYGTESKTQKKRKGTSDLSIESSVNQENIEKGHDDLPHLVMVGMERVLIKFEKRRKVKIERKRVNLKEKRKEYGLEWEKKQRISGRGYTRLSSEERAEAIVLSGKLPTTTRRTNLIVRELEAGLNHIEVLRRRERGRKQHARRSPNGVKDFGRSSRNSTQDSSHQSGYYGYKILVKGPLDGARRTMTHVIQIGTVPRGRKRGRRRVSHEHAKTKIGTLGVRVTYCYGRA